MEIIGDLIKILGGIALFIPLMKGVIELEQRRKDRLDENYRSIVKGLTSEKPEERLASVTSIGTFIKKGNPYYELSMDILINRISMELDINVLNAIRGSLEKIAAEDYAACINKLLQIDRNYFIYEYPLKDWIAREEDNKKDMEVAYKRLQRQRPIVSNFIASFIGFSRDRGIEGISFYQNSLNNVVLSDMQLFKPVIKRSALSFSTLTNAVLDGAHIEDTVFTFSNMRYCTFKDCEIKTSLFDQTGMEGVYFKNCRFKDVFFTGADMKMARFENIEGLKPVYFYKSINIDQSSLDDGFLSEVDKIKDTVHGIIKPVITKTG